MDVNNQSNLTLKQRKFVKEYIELGNATEAASRVYKVSSRHSAEQIGYENLRNVEINGEIEAQLSREGLNVVKFVTSLNEALGATNREYNYQSGSFEYTPDHATRLNAVKIIHRLLGY